MGISQSMGRVASALDNAVIESWHSTLEFELRQLEHFATKAQARARVPTWIEQYNHDRRSLGSKRCGATLHGPPFGTRVHGALILLAVWQARHAAHVKLAAALWAGIATLLAVAVNQPIVYLVAEPRPYQTHPGILVLVARSSDWSFPSDHSVMAGACAVGLLIASRRLGVMAAAAALLMAAARVYVGAHYPVDVLVGLLLGAVVAGAGWLMLRRALVLFVARGRGLSLLSR